MSADPRHLRGSDAERLACDHLRDRGFELVERNWRCRSGELDLVMRDGDVLVIVEVRCRLGGPAQDAALTVTRRKRQRMRAAVCVYQWQRGLGDSIPIRLDLVAIGGTEARPEIKWFRNFAS